MTPVVCFSRQRPLGCGISKELRLLRRDTHVNGAKQTGSRSIRLPSLFDRNCKMVRPPLSRGGHRSDKTACHYVVEAAVQLYNEHNSSSLCRLQVGLGAVPPRDDITLIASRAANRGEFSGLPEGAAIAAASTAIPTDGRSRIAAELPGMMSSCTIRPVIRPMLPSPRSLPPHPASAFMVRTSGLPARDQAGPTGLSRRGRLWRIHPRRSRRPAHRCGQSP